MKKRKRFKTTEDILFYIGCAGLAVFAAVWPAFLKTAPMLVTGCRFLAVTGLYCPAFGGTRALNALLHGHVIASLKLNPAVAYGAAIFVWFMLSQTAERLSRHKLKIGMRYRNLYVYVGLAVLMGQWLVKNIIKIAAAM